MDEPLYMCNKFSRNVASYIIALFNSLTLRHVARNIGTLSMYDGNATTTAKTSSNKLLRRRVVVYYPLHVYMNWVQFEEIKTNGLWIIVLFVETPRKFITAKLQN
jgi:hypothetical protein